jgi:hypothetical protein
MPQVLPVDMPGQDADIAATEVKTAVPVPPPVDTTHMNTAAPAFQCKSNTFFKNIHAVSLCELLTLDVAIVGGATIGVGLLADWSPLMITLAVIIVLVVMGYLHYLADIPSNLSYYLGWGRPPHVFKVCKCEAPKDPKPEPKEDYTSVRFLKNSEHYMNAPREHYMNAPREHYIGVPREHYMGRR